MSGIRQAAVASASAMAADGAEIEIARHCAGAGIPVAESRIVDDAVLLDLRCLEREQDLLDALAALRDRSANDVSS